VCVAACLRQWVGVVWCGVGVGVGVVWVWVGSSSVLAAVGGCGVVVGEY